MIDDDVDEYVRNIFSVYSKGSICGRKFDVANAHDELSPYIYSILQKPKPKHIYQVRFGVFRRIF